MGAVKKDLTSSSVYLLQEYDTAETMITSQWALLTATAVPSSPSSCEKHREATGGMERAGGANNSPQKSE